MIEARGRGGRQAPRGAGLSTAWTLAGGLLACWLVAGPVAGPVAMAAEGVRLLAGDVPYCLDDVAGASGGEPFTSRTIDVYGPAEDAPAGEPAAARPIVLFIHGGGWRHGDKAHVGHKPRAFVRQGYVFASANYRLQEPVTPREQAGDIAAAVAWLHEHAAGDGGDPGRLFLVGHSAGAHLAALVATDGRLLAAHGLDPGAIRGVVLLDGAAYDVPRQMAQARLPALAEIYRRAFGDDPDAWRDSSPVEHVHPGQTYPPFQLFHVGMREDSREQAGLLAGRLREAGGVADVVHEPGKNHMTLNRELGLPGDEPTAKVFRFLKGAVAAE